MKIIFRFDNARKSNLEIIVVYIEFWLKFAKQEPLQSRKFKKVTKLTHLSSKYATFCPASIKKSYQDLFPYPRHHHHQKHQQH